MTATIEKTADAAIAALFDGLDTGEVACLHHYPLHSQVLTVERFTDPADAVQGEPKVRAIVKYGVTNQIAGMYVFTDPDAAVSFLSGADDLAAMTASTTAAQRVVTREEADAWEERLRVHRHAAEILRIPRGCSSAEEISGHVAEAELKRICRDLQVGALAAKIRHESPDARTATIHLSAGKISITRVEDIKGHPIASALVGEAVLDEWTFGQLRRTFEPSKDGAGVRIPLQLLDIRQVR